MKCLGSQSLLKYYALTINVPVFIWAQGIIILMQENPFHGQLEGMGPENKGFFGP
jgi:hypothetical protein